MPLPHRPLILFWICIELYRELFLFFLTWRLFFFWRPVWRSLGSEGCRGEAPAARASERRRVFLEKLFVALLRCVSLMAAKRITKSIGRDAGVREDFGVGLGNMDCLLAEVGKSFSEGDRVNAEG